MPIHLIALRCSKIGSRSGDFYTNNLELRHVLQILRKHPHRDSVGKESSFRVRGQPVTMDNVHHYVERNEGLKGAGNI